MTKLDLAALVFVALTAFLGYRKGLIASALSVAGIVLGAYVGSRLGLAGQRLVMEHFDFSVLARRLEDFYQEVLGRTAVVVS